MVKLAQSNSDILEEIRERKEKYNYWMDVKEAAEFASVSETTLWRGVEKGELKVSRKTGKLLFRRYWINNWLKDVKS